MRKTKTPYRINNKTILIELTDKGRLPSQKYLKLFSNFFDFLLENISEMDNVVYGLFTKSVEELKEMVREKDIIELILMNKANREANNNYSYQ